MSSDRVPTRTYTLTLASHHRVLPTNQILANVTTGHKPRGVDTNPYTNTVYITNTESHSVIVLDGTTDTIIKTIEVGDTPWRVAVEPETNMVYVTNTNSNEISIINGVTNTLVNTEKIQKPYDIAVDSETNKVFVGTLSSLKEFSGIGNSISETEEKFCKEGYRLVFKATNGSPTCVFPDSVEKLIQRGWATLNP